MYKTHTQLTTFTCNRTSEIVKIADVKAHNAAHCNMLRPSDCLILLLLLDTVMEERKTN